MESQHFLIDLIPHGNDREELWINFVLYSISYFKYNLLICSSLMNYFAAMNVHLTYLEI